MDYNLKGNEHFTLQRDNVNLFNVDELDMNGYGYGVESSLSISVYSVTLSGYNLTKGFVAVLFSSVNPAEARLNINNQGEKPIQFNGNPLTAGVITAGTVGLFYYDGNRYQLVSVFPYGLTGTELAYLKITLPQSTISSDSASIIDKFSVSETTGYTQVADLASLPLGMYKVTVQRNFHNPNSKNVDVNLILQGNDNISSSSGWNTISCGSKRMTGVSSGTLVFTCYLNHASAFASTAGLRLINEGDANMQFGGAVPYEGTYTGTIQNDDYILFERIGNSPLV